MTNFTLAILKPHVFKNPFARRKIQEQILDNGFKIIKERNVVINGNLSDQFYGEHRTKFFYQRLISFMSSGPSSVYILSRDSAITKWREMLGPTKVYKALYSHPDSVRGMYGLSDTRNACHGSDSPESAKREILIFFPDFDFVVPE